jgi:hypothetical protein
MIDTNAPTQPALSPTPVGWTESTSYTMQWAASTDVLSGVAKYLVYQNGSLVTSTTETRITLDSLKDGQNRIGVAAMDRAGNVSGASFGDIYVDSAAPGVRIIAPMKNQVVGVRPTFSAEASDAAGIKKVVFSVDGFTLASLVSSPYASSVDLSRFKTGTHTLVVTAYDQLGATLPTHRTTVSTKFYLDRTAPALTRVSSGPSPFFPKLRDHYLDDSFVRFNLSKSARVSLTVRTRSGAIVQTLKYSMRPGAQTITWNGMTSRGKVAGEGTYYYRLSAIDSVGNSSSTGQFPVRVQYYVVVRVSASSARLVAH